MVINCCFVFQPSNPNYISWCTHVKRYIISIMYRFFPSQQSLAYSLTNLNNIYKNKCGMIANDSFMIKRPNNKDWTKTRYRKVINIELSLQNSKQDSICISKKNRARIIIVTERFSKALFLKCFTVLKHLLLHLRRIKCIYKSLTYIVSYYLTGQYL